MDIGQIGEVGARFNLEKGLIANLSKSQASAKGFLAVVEHSKLKEGVKKVGNMLYSVATKMSVNVEVFKFELAALIGSGQIDNPTQLDYIIEYLKNQEVKGGANIEVMKKQCGVGVKLTKEQIEAIIKEEIKDAQEKSNKTQYLIKVKGRIPFVEGKIVKEYFDLLWKEKGLPQNFVQKKAEQKKGHKKQKQEEQEVFHIKDISQLIGRQMRSAVNSKQNLIKRAQQFGQGTILTRFPPQPNGYLHIGHCKAMRFNFMQANVSKGHCYLRFDDTNPLKQNKQFIQNIKQNINFMGYLPWKITHASDQFTKLHQFAVRLIQQGDAFVCSQAVQQMRLHRSEGIPSKDRNRSPQQNLRLFQQMRLGLHGQGSYSLRAKIDYKHPNTTLRDPVIYRIRFTAHPHVGDKWCIYPLYDFTHPLCDSLQGISHSLCSLEFQIRRELYYWVLQKLDIFRPNVWEYSRLNITYNVLSKRKLHELVFNHHVDGWDDPRLLTINGMRRKGYPAEAINNFCDAIGVTRRGNENYINFNVLENEVRKYLDAHAPRTMVVLDPVLLILEGVETQGIEVPLFPKEKEKGVRRIQLTNRIYVERSDVRLEDSEGFYGIAPNKIVGLKYTSPVYIKEVRSEEGKVREIVGVLCADGKPNSYLNWISCEECFECEVRNYGLLFNVQKPGESQKFLDLLNRNSMEKSTKVKAHRDLLLNMKMEDRYQFERKGFYCLDKETDIKAGRIIWNQTVGLVDRKK